MTRQEVIDQYLSQSFQKHPRFSHPGTFNVLKDCVENVYGRKSALFCIDVEAWERNNSKITEIGISIYDPRDQENAIVPSFHTYHIRPKEHMHMRNGRYVPNNASFFAGCSTLAMPLDTCVEFMQALINKYFNDDSIHCYLVGHDLRGDIKWLRSMNIAIPEVVPQLDTQTFLSFLTQSKRSLTNCLSLMGISHSKLHNAGNDAYFTLLLALKMSDPEARQLYGLDGEYPVLMPKHFRGKSEACPVVEIESAEGFLQFITDNGYR